MSRRPTGRERRRKRGRGLIPNPPVEEWFKTLPELRTRENLLSLMQTDPSISMRVFSMLNRLENIGNIPDLKAMGTALDQIVKFEKNQITKFAEEMDLPKIVISEWGGLLKNLYLNMLRKRHGELPKDRLSKKKWMIYRELKSV